MSYENETQEENDTVVRIERVFSQDKITALLFDSFVYGRATLDATAHLQIRALSQLTNSPVDELEVEFEALRKNYLYAYAKILQGRFDQPAANNIE